MAEMHNMQIAVCLNVPQRSSHHLLWLHCLLYRSPELINSPEAITPATDMWSWACIIIHMATEQVPFAGLNIMQISRKVSSN